jgi:rRNA pseudouridine-1189 N-methylase Emg1 (Nep1/Mra1 family)
MRSIFLVIHNFLILLHQESRRERFKKMVRKKAVVINDLTQGSIIPKSTLRFNDIMKKYFNDEEILKINMEKLIELDIPNKEGVIDYIILETDPKTVLEIVGVGLFGSLFGRGYARSERRNRNLYKKSTTFDFDLLVRSIINIPENNTLTHFTFEQLKDCHLRIKNGEDEL